MIAWIDAAVFEESIERLYRNDGLLAAEVDVQEPELRNGISTVRVVVREGEPYVVGRVDLQGAGGLPETELRKVPGSRARHAVSNGAAC